MLTRADNRAYCSVLISEPMNKLFKIYLLVLISVMISSTALSQVGREFWFVAPEATSSHGDKPIFFRVTTFDQGTNITISFPANPSITPITAYVPANSQYSTLENSFELNDIENRPSNQVNNKGVLIEAHDADVSAYYEIAHSGNPDKFTLKGSNALGQEFFIPSQNSYRNNKRNPIASEKVDIVATVDGTEVVIVPTVDVVGHSAGDTIKVSLNRGQSFSVENQDISKESSLGGTYVASNQPIAITISDDSIHNNDGGSAHDMIGDQLVPVSVIGTEYVIVNTSTDHVAGNRGTTLREVYVVATEDNTVLYRNGEASAFKTLQRGEMAQVTVTEDNMFLQASYPIYVYQLSSMRFDGDGNEIGSAVLPHSGCTGSDVVTVKRIFTNEFFLQLMVQGRHRNSFSVTDSDNTAHTFLNNVPWVSVPGTDTNGTDETWYTANIELSNDISTDKVYFIRNATGLFHLSILEENRSSVSYGYFSSYSNLNVNGITEACKGNFIILRTDEPMSQYAWYSDLNPGNLLSNADTLAVNQTGKYWVTATVLHGGCTLTDSIDVVFKLPEIDLGGDTIVCPGTTLDFSGIGNSNDFLWSNGDTDYQTSVSVGENYNGELSVTVTDVDGCFNEDTVQIEAFQVPDINLDVTTVCRGQSVTCTTPFESYEWVLNGTTLNADFTQNYINPTVSGSYELSAWTADGCSTNRVFDIIVHDLPEFTLNGITVCDGTNERIDGPSGAGYLYNWSDGTTASYINMSVPDDYWLEVTDANGCVFSDTASFALHMAIPIDLGPDRSECAQVTLDIVNSSDFYDFTWRYNDGINPTVVLSTPSPEYRYHITNAKVEDSGLYMVEAKDINGCTVSDTVEVGFYDTNPPVLTISRNLCDGDTIQIQSSKGYDNYYWEFDGSSLPQFDDMDSILVDQPGTYVLRAHYLTCIKQSNINVSAYALPQVALPADYSICPETETEINIESYTKSIPENEFDYLYWDNNSSQRFSDWTSAKLKVNQNGQHTVTVVDTLGCVATDEINIGVHTLANLDLGAPQTTCENTGYNLHNSVPGTYSWYKVENGGDQWLTDDTDYLTTETGSYSLHLTDPNGCELSDTLVVHAHPQPSVELGSDIQMCEYENVTLRAQGSTNSYVQYRWNNDPALSSPGFVATQSGTYKLEVANAFGCWAADSVDVVAIPVASFDLVDHPLDCPGLPKILSGPPGMSSYLWSTLETTQSVEKYAGTYWLKVVDNNGCEYTDTTSISYHPVPNINIGIDTVICPINASFNIEPSFMPGTDVSNYSYQWHNGLTTPGIEASLFDTINIVTVSNEFGCTSSDDLLVILKESPDLSLLDDQAICNFDSLELDGGFDYIEWLWSTGEVTPYITVREAGEYRLRVSDGCVYMRDTMLLEVDPTPVVARIDTSIFAQVVLYPEGGTAPYQYAINNGFFQNENVFRNLENGDHEFLVEDANGCLATQLVTINDNLDVEVPNFFTPNGDGFNDTWEIDGLERLPDSEIRIYDRFGKLLVKYLASEPGWDGTYLGKHVRSDDYWYVVEVKPANKLLKGNLTLKR